MRQNRLTAYTKGSNSIYLQAITRNEMSIRIIGDFVSGNQLWGRWDTHRPKSLWVV
jgi:hypothetical protein